MAVVSLTLMVFRELAGMVKAGPVTGPAGAR